MGVNGAIARVRVLAPGPEELVVRPVTRLARGVYELRWHSVSADDGHALDGSYYFGVQSAAPAGAQTV